MLPEYKIQRADENDLDDVMSIFRTRRDWLRAIKGSDQWSNVGEWRTLVRHFIRNGTLWVVVTNDEAEDVVATVTLSRDPDIDFWTGEARRDSALYLSKLATMPAHSGRGLGEMVLDWAVDHAAREGHRFVRLDTWKTSSQLQEYYSKRGWRRLHVVDLGHRQSGALFERVAQHLELSLVVDERRGQRKHRELVVAASGAA